MDEQRHSMIRGLPCSWSKGLGWTHIIYKGCHIRRRRAGLPAYAGRWKHRNRHEATHLQRRAGCIPGPHGRAGFYQKTSFLIKKVNLLRGKEQSKIAGHCPAILIFHANLVLPLRSPREGEGLGEETQAGFRNSERGFPLPVSSCQLTDHAMYQTVQSPI